MTLAPVEPLVLRELRVAFGDVRAVDGVDLVVRAGSVTGLVGPNGCGKTTTLRAVLGLVRPAAGTVAVAGIPGGLAARAHVAWVPDEPGGLDELTVDEFVDLVGALWRADAGYAARAALLLDAFGLATRRRSMLASLSHGQRRLVTIAAAVALRRALLIVDEATAALDPEAVITLREVVRTVAARGGGVLLATQDLAFAERVCDRVTLLARGRVAAEGTSHELRAQFGAASLEEVFVAAAGVAERQQEVRSALEAL